MVSKQKIIAGIVAVIVVCLAIVYAITSQPSIVVKTQEIEAGDKVSLTKESLLDTEKWMLNWWMTSKSHPI